MAATGQIQVNAYIGAARIPQKDVAITVTDAGGSAIAMRLTNRSGQLDVPISVIAPDKSESLSPGSVAAPFTSVDLYARKENFEEIFVRDLQVFADTTTTQDLILIPLSEFPESWNEAEHFRIPPQNL